MLRKVATALIPVTIFAALTACAQNGDRELSDEARAEESHKTVTYREHSSVTGAATPSKPPAGESGKAPQDLLSRMAQDLAQRLNVRSSALQVLSVESVVWDDGSLGCPEPGRAYITAQVPGSRVLFQHAGKTYQYHASERGHFVYCANPATPAGSFDRQ
ncbi:MAG: hypothetical protein ACREV5_12500 [Steroidobacter sp.]